MKAPHLEAYAPQSSAIQGILKQMLDDFNQNLADDTTLREETQAQLTADEEFFDSLKQGCKKKADEWAARSRVRTEELGSINEAITILSDGSATFEASATTFLQVDHSAMSPRKAAYNALKKAATHAKNVQLAALASRVFMGTG